METKLSASEQKIENEILTYQPFTGADKERIDYLLDKMRKTRNALEILNPAMK